jgi:hypothetical protein
MQGVFIEGRRPKSKKEVREAVSAGRQVELERTALVGNEYGGDVTQAPEGQAQYFVGPDPYTSRKFYGQVLRRGDKVTVK